jgi:hypothetical protein
MMMVTMPDKKTIIPAAMQSQEAGIDMPGMVQAPFKNLKQATPIN